MARASPRVCPCRRPADHGRLHAGGLRVELQQGARRLHAHADGPHPRAPRPGAGASALARVPIRCSLPAAHRRTSRSGSFSRGGEADGDGLGRVVLKGPLGSKEVNAFEGIRGVNAHRVVSPFRASSSEGTSSLLKGRCRPGARPPCGAPRLAGPSAPRTGPLAPCHLTPGCHPGLHGHEGGNADVGSLRAACSRMSAAWFARSDAEEDSAAATQTCYRDLQWPAPRAAAAAWPPFRPCPGHGQLPDETSTEGSRRQCPASSATASLRLWRDPCGCASHPASLCPSRPATSGTSVRSSVPRPFAASRRRNLPLATSHSLIVLSPLPEASSLPSPRKARKLTPKKWP